MVTCHMFLVMTAYVMLSNCLFEGLKPTLREIRNWKLKNCNMFADCEMLGNVNMSKMFDNQRDNFLRTDWSVTVSTS